MFFRSAGGVAPEPANTRKQSGMCFGRFLVALAVRSDDRIPKQGQRSARHRVALFASETRATPFATPRLSGSLEPSRGCLPGPQEAGSTMPRPQQRGRGLHGRVWAHSWALPGNRCHSRTKQAQPPDCKSAIVGSTPTGASASETPAMCRQQRPSQGFFCFQPRSRQCGRQAAQMPQSANMSPPEPSRSGRFSEPALLCHPNGKRCQPPKMEKLASCPDLVACTLFL